MNQDFDLFDLPEMPYIIITNPNKAELYSISGFVYNTKLISRFNALSEFEFSIPSTIDNGLTTLECYAYIQAKRFISIENEGYFIIDSVEEKTNGQHPIKVVKSKSLEGEMLNKRFTSFKGTYKFYDLIPDPNVITLTDKILELLPSWSMGYVDLTVAAKYRTFDISDSTVYSFLINDCEKSYSCIFDFDTNAKTINVYSVDKAIVTTDIYLSYENLIKNSSFTELTDEISTALTVYGSGTLSISSVNPLGSNKIYDFTYYKTTDWMTQGLIDAVTAWEALILSNQPTYAGLLTSYRTKNYELIILQGELVILQNAYTAKETEQKALISIGQSISAVNTELLAIKANIDLKNAEIVAKQAELTAITVSITAINTALSFDVNFTEAEYEELSEFIYENTYQNNTLVVTDQTTAVQYQDTAQELYDQAIGVLSRSSLPRYEFTMDTANFIAMKEFSAFTGELELGCSVTVAVNDNYSIVPVLLEITRSFDNPSAFSLTFSNRLRLDNGNFQYADLMGQVVSTGSAVSGYSQQWGNWDENYKDTVSEFITSSLDASLNSVINSSNQEILINANGLRGRTLDPNTGDYDPNQVWLTSNLLVFTDDNWDSAKLALGKIDYNGNTVFGLVGDVIVGRILAGNQLQITNEGSNFTLDQDGARLNNASFVLQNGQNAIILSPNEETINGIVTKGISIQSNASGTWENVFYTDVLGNLVLKAGITAEFGDIGGWKINSTGLYDTHGNYIYSNGNIKLGGLTITPGVARFAGDLYATNLYGRVVGAGNYQYNSITPDFIDHLSANDITTGTMSADHIYGGTITGPGGIEISLEGKAQQPSIVSDEGWWIRTNNGLGNISILPDFVSIGPYIYMDGDTEFNGPIRVTNGGTGRTLTVTVGTSELKFVNGILVEGSSGPWGPGGGGDGEIPTGSDFSWDKTTITGTDVILSAFAVYPCTLASIFDVDKTYISISAKLQGDAGTHIHVYGLDAGLNRIIEGTVTIPLDGKSIHVSFSPDDPTAINGFELALDAGGTSTIYTPTDEVSTGTLDGWDSAGIVLTGTSAGNWYAVEGTGGPWYSLPIIIPENAHHTFYMSDDGIESGLLGGDESPLSVYLELPTFASYAEAIDTVNARCFWQSDGSVYRMHLAPGGGGWGDNSGSMSYILRNAVVTSGRIVTLGVTKIFNLWS